MWQYYDHPMKTGKIHFVRLRVLTECNRPRMMTGAEALCELKLLVSKTATDVCPYER